jgi:glucan 1,3-beta-glucosidase
MSFRSDHFLKFSNKEQAFGILPADLSLEDVRNLFIEVLNNGVHGFCFSLYEDGQRPGDEITPDQIRKRLEILRPYTKWIRSFSTTEGNEWIPQIAKEMGMKTLVGAWLESDEEKNRIEIDNLIELANSGFVDIAAVGNEVLYRKELSVDQLMEYIRYTRQKTVDIPVGYVDAYYEFAVHPELVKSCDVILSNCYPFWEGTSFEYSLQHMKQMYDQVKGVSGAKKVIITETGWPSFGRMLGNAAPGRLEALKYFIQTQLWAVDQGAEVFYFSSFDESWKVDTEGDVGAYWGVWDSNGYLKYI